MLVLLALIALWRVCREECAAAPAPPRPRRRAPTRDAGMQSDPRLLFVRHERLPTYVEDEAAARLESATHFARAGAHVASAFWGFATEGASQTERPLLGLPELRDATTDPPDAGDGMRDAQTQIAPSLVDARVPDDVVYSAGRSRDDGAYAAGAYAYAFVAQAPYAAVGSVFSGPWVCASRRLYGGAPLQIEFEGDAGADAWEPMVDTVIAPSAVPSYELRRLCALWTRVPASAKRSADDGDAIRCFVASPSADGRSLRLTRGYGPSRGGHDPSHDGTEEEEEAEETRGGEGGRTTTKIWTLVRTEPPPRARPGTRTRRRPLPGGGGAPTATFRRRGRCDRAGWRRGRVGGRGQRARARRRRVCQGGPRRPHHDVATPRRREGKGRAEPRSRFALAVAARDDPLARVWRRRGARGAAGARLPGTERWCHGHYGGSWTLQRVAPIGREYTDTDDGRTYRAYRYRHLDFFRSTSEDVAAALARREQRCVAALRDAPPIRFHDHRAAELRDTARGVSLAFSLDGHLDVAQRAANRRIIRAVALALLEHPELTCEVHAQASAARPRSAAEEARIRTSRCALRCRGVPPPTRPIRKPRRGSSWPRSAASAPK